ncbi:SMI1/KNR4 family protein [Listeria booriae]|uniref:SMI1/KNR4 family protein n=1 Tax=Listeria booriae TaxID=1552123 RepID=UPI0016276E6D|nr:SMI1/KNR4 family protein [Listeria booriae]MBC2366982.1 SMI1/KNR4 family protein [Listeria booriae]
MGNIDKMNFLNKYTFNKSLKVELIDVHDVDKGTLPESWNEVFENDELSLKIKYLLQLWENTVGNDLRNTIAYLNRHLRDIELMRLGEKYFILYSIESSKTSELLFYVGGNPLEKNFKNQEELFNDWAKIPETLKNFYESLHDGFYYFPSRSMGLDAVENVTYLGEDDWEIVEEMEQPLEIQLESSYGFFSNGMGRYVVVDANDCDNDKATLWSATSLPKYDLKFWNVVDEWIVIGFN